MEARQRKEAKAAPASKPGKWDKPPLEVSATKKGPGRKAPSSKNAAAPLTVSGRRPKTAIANVGRRTRIAGLPKSDRRFWRENEPVHIVKPVRAARLAAKRAPELEAA